MEVKGFEGLKKTFELNRKDNYNDKPQVIVVGRSNVGKSTLVRLITKKKVRVGKKPGVTLKINRYPMGNYTLVDLPGFGFMSGLDEKIQNNIKDEIIKYIESNAEKISCSILLIDGKAFLEIVNRWDNRNEIPIDIEMFDFLNELELNPIIFINKMDKIKRNKWDEQLDNIVELFGFLPPWRQWLDKLIVGSLKNEIGLKEVLIRMNKYTNEYIKNKRIKNNNKNNRNSKNNK